MKKNDKNSRQIIFSFLILLMIVGSVVFFSGLLLGIAAYHFQTDKTLVLVASGPEDSQPDYQNELLDIPSEQDAENQEHKDNIEERTDFSVILKKNTDEAALRARQSRRSSTPATEEQIKVTLFFLPDVLVEVNGKKILKQQIVDLLLSKKVSQYVLDQTSESHLRSYMPQYIDQVIDMEILKQKAKEAGFVPSEELVKTHFDYSISKMHTEQVNDLKAQIEEQGYTLESYRNEIAKETDVQVRAAIAAYEEEFFVAEAEKNITDADVKKFYNENRQNYYVPDLEDYLPFDKVKQEICDFLVDKAVSEEIQTMIKAERAKSDIKVYSFYNNSPVMFVHATNLK